jgi:MFS family permease
VQESLFFFTESLLILQWGRLSDRVGRKPVLLMGVFGLALSMICFGFSKTFWALVISRALAGALNGNVGVVKSMLGEITDDSNMPQAFAFLPICWAGGSTIG